MEKFVVLEYATNSCYTNVISLEKAEKEYKNRGLSVNIKKNTWHFDGVDRKITDTRHCSHGSRWGVIGVYNQEDVKHLNSMISAAREATKSSTSHSHFG